ncbi:MULTISPECIES: hypothetical protein [Flavobacterium]|uniref:Uncharacterized protein n=1 Tax=Flavobacterium salmonis TaxID=2654844 RepID=A0A6V6YT96_9FLAO|nr:MULTISPECIES: hypothetical protein [Flavobacterium]OOV20368.1 hypothetical protein BXU10_12410 [Flavobacterium sp. LM4]CAD0001932.1 hypothetical protein FLAT13_00816 [Flavobacterium salmonis]
MTFNKILKTDLGVTEVIDKLNIVTEKFHTNSGNKYKFEGKIYNSEFQIFPTFDYGSRNQLRPEINGKIEKHENYSLVNLKFKVQDYLKLPIFIIIILNLAFAIFLFIKPISSFFTWNFFIILLSAAFLIFYISFKVKIESSTKLLCQILTAEIIG